MGISYLSRFCAAVLLAAAIAPAFAANDRPNYFYNAATKTWIPSRDAVITPQGTIINNSAASQAQRFLDGQGGFVNKSTVHANFPAVKKTVPITIDAKTPASRVKLGAKSVLKGGLVGIAVGVAFDEFLGGLDWVMGEGGKIQKKAYSGEGGDLHGAVRVNAADVWIVQSTTCPVFVPAGSTVTCTVTYDGGNRGIKTDSYSVNGSSPPLLVGYRHNGAFQMFSYSRTTTGSASSEPVTDSEIDAAVDSSYVPHVDDWDWLAPYMDPTAIEITDLPRLMSPPVTKTIYDADGNPVQVSETNIWHDFDIRNNDSVQPEIEVKTTEETKVYENGTLVSTNTITSTAEPDPAPSTSGGDDFEIPTDCDFMPTVCAFLDWFKDDDLGDDPDLKSIMKDDEDFAKTKTISFGAAVCPAPYTIQIPSLGMSADLSFEFFCQFAEYAKALVLAAAYIFAAYISLGVARG